MMTMSISPRTMSLPKNSLALLLGAALLSLPSFAQAQTADAGDQPAAPATVAPSAPAATAPAAAAPGMTPAADAVAALDLGDCPDNAVGLDQGKTYSCACPALGEPAIIYGSDIYTADSNICTAAVHAGARQRSSAGSVTLQTIASPQVFKGATRNGIKSEAWAQPADAAFRFASAK
jgi:LCCL domain